MLTIPRGRDLGVKGIICVSQITPTCLHPSLAIVQLPTWLSSKQACKHKSLTHNGTAPTRQGPAVPGRSTQGPGTYSVVSVVGGGSGKSVDAPSLSQSAPPSRALQLCRLV